MNIYWFELKSITKSTILWIVSLAALCVFMMSLFPAFAESADEFRTLLAGWPPEVSAALGMDIDTLFGVIGFYSYTFLYITLCGAVQAANLGIGLVSKENRAKTADFLLTKPVQRRSVLTAKLLAALTALAATNLVYLIVSTLMCYAVKDTPIDGTALILISLTLFFTQIVFVCIGALVAVFFCRIKSVISASLGLTLLLFMLSMVDAVIDKAALKYITPFLYFDTAAIAENSAYEWSSLLTALVVCILCLTVTYIRTIRNDIHAV